MIALDGLVQEVDDWLEENVGNLALDSEAPRWPWEMGAYQVQVEQLRQREQGVLQGFNAFLEEAPHIAPETASAYQEILAEYAGRLTDCYRHVVACVWYQRLQNYGKQLPEINDQLVTLWQDDVTIRDRSRG